MTFNITVVLAFGGRGALEFRSSSEASGGKKSLKITASEEQYAIKFCFKLRKNATEM